MTNRASPLALPCAPVDLVAVAIGGSQVILAWTECWGEGGGLGYCVERAVCHIPCKAFAEIGKVGPHVAAFRDGSVAPRTSYHYRVHAWNASGDSAPSNVVEVTTPQIGAESPDHEG
jgi:hypothetical protein